VRIFLINLILDFRKVSVLLVLINSITSNGRPTDMERFFNEIQVQLDLTENECVIKWVNNNNVIYIFGSKNIMEFKLKIKQKVSQVSPFDGTL
jgi:hypothetical protein